MPSLTCDEVKLIYNLPPLNQPELIRSIASDPYQCLYDRVNVSVTNVRLEGPRVVNRDPNQMRTNHKLVRVLVMVRQANSTEIK